MSERVVRRDVVTGEAEIIALEDALSELSTGLTGLYSEIAPRLRGGECLRLPDGRSYSAAATVELETLLPLPASAVN